MKTIWLMVGMLVTLFVASVTLADELDRTPLEASTAKGDKVLLYPTGRWEYVNAAQAETAKKVAEQYPENKTRPVDAQGGAFGMGRLVMPGDKDYNRGSLNPKNR
jgi:hypothetical protein